MRRNIGLIILFISIICLSVIYIAIDRELYCYGVNNFKTNKNTLPIGLKPNYYGSDVSFPIQGFVIEDMYRFLIIGKNRQYKYDTISFETSEVIKYGYNEEFLLAFMKSTSGNYYYVKVFNDSNLHGEVRLGYNIFRSDKEEAKNNFRWVNVKQDESKVSKLIRIRIRVLIGLILMVPLWLIVSWIFKKKKEIDANEKLY